MADAIKQAYEDGGMAFLCGCTEQECPYGMPATDKRVRKLYAAWRMGWMASKEGNERRLAE
jgi:hypothetical protein